MKTINKTITLAGAFGLSVATITDAKAVIVDSGISSAQDILVNATVSASAVGLNLVNVGVALPPLNEATGNTAVNGTVYSITPPVLDPSASVASGLLTLNASASALDISADSVGIGGPGSNTTSGNATVASVGASLQALAFNLLSVTVTTPGTGTSVLTSYAEMTGDGVNVTPNATSNLLTTSGAVLNITVLGIDLGVNLAGLTANSTVVLPISLVVDDVLLTSRTSITGFVTVRPDSVTESFNGVTGSATATALNLTVDVDVSQTTLPLFGDGVPILDADINANVIVAQSAAAVTAVPEPLAPAMAVVGGLLCAARRRRPATV